MKTISLPEDLHKELARLKLEEGRKNTAELIKQLVVGYKKQKFLRASRIFNDAMKKKGLTLKKLIAKSERIREELADEDSQD